MNVRTILFYTLAILMGGCGTVSTLHPLHTKKDVTFDERLLGTWAEDPNNTEEVWIVERNEDKDPNAYKLTLSGEDDMKGVFEMYLLKLDGDLYVDVAPAAFPSGKEDIEDVPYPLNAFHFARLHTFVKVETIAPKLTFKITEKEKFEELLEEHPNAVSCTETEDEMLIVLAETEKLQAFVKKFKNNEKLFTNEVELVRVKIGAPGSADCSTEEGQKSR